MKVRLKLNFTLLFIFSTYLIWGQSNKVTSKKITPSVLLENIKTAHREQFVEMVLPSDISTTEEFKFTEIDNCLPDNLKQKYPQIKTYRGISKSNPEVTALLTVGDEQVLGSIIDHKQVKSFYNDTKTSNFTFEKTSAEEVDCAHCKQAQMEANLCNETPNSLNNNRSSFLTTRSVTSAPTYSHGSTYRTFRFGLILSYWQMQALGYTTKVQGVTLATSKITLMNEVFGKEVAAKFELISQEEDIIFLTSSDLYPEANTTEISNLFSTNKTVMNTYVGDANYDWAYLFHPGSSPGRGALDMCRQSDSKYKGGSINDNGLMLHEMGHMFGGSHSYHLDKSIDIPALTNGIVGSNGGKWFHAETWEVAATNMDTWTCGSAAQPTGNTPPTITQYTAGGVYIPKNTPFVLRGQATDPDPTASLSYSWEHMNVTASEELTPTAAGRLIWSWSNPSSTTNVQYIPSLQSQLDNTIDRYSILPTVSRPIAARFIVRDNQVPYGGATYQDISFNVDDNAGPFLVTYPNTAFSFTGGQNINVTWDVANTNNALVNVQQVNILISTDRAATWTTLASNVSNSGSYTVTLPNITSTQCRIKVEAVDNIFYDMSNIDFSIFSNNTNDFTFTALNNYQAVLQSNTADYQFNFTKVGVFTNNVTVSFSGVPSGATMNALTQLTSSGDFNIQLQNANAVAAGKYNITITLTETGGSIIKSQVFTFVKKAAGEGVPGKSLKTTYANSTSMGAKATVRSVTTNNFTMALWMKSISPYVHTPNNTTYREPILAFGDNAYIYLHANADVGFVYKDMDYQQSSTKATRGVWNHYALTVSPDKAVLYLNGQPILTSALRRGAINLGSDLYIGRGVSWFKVNLGEYDEVKVFNRALTATEIQETMHRNDDYDNPNLMEYFQFNENTTSGPYTSSASFSTASVLSTTLSYSVPSSIPAGNAIVSTLAKSNSLTPYGTTGVSLQFATTNASETATVHKINTPPNTVAGIDPAQALLHTGHYWEINAYPSNTNTITTALFTVPYDVLPNDNRLTFILYYRNQTSDSAWIYHSLATAFDAATNTLTFSNLPQKAQYVIYKKIDPVISLSKIKDVPTCPLTNQTQGSEIFEFKVEAANLTNPASLQFANPNILLSTNAASGFVSPLVLPAGDGNLSQSIYVKYNGTTTGYYSDTLKGSTTPTPQLQSVPFTFSYGKTTGRGNALKLVDKNAGLKFDAFTGTTPTAFTIEFWMKPTEPLIAYGSLTSTSNHTQGLGRVGRFQMYCSDAVNGKLKIGTSTFIESPAGTLQIGKWVHIAFTWQKLNTSPITYEKKLYINGSLIPHSIDPTFGSTSSWADMHIGGGTVSTILSSFYSAQNFGGEIDEFRVWNTVRTQQQIQENMHLVNDLSTSCAEGLIVYYQFNEAQGNLNNSNTGPNLVGKPSTITTTATISGTTYTATTLPSLITSSAPVGFGGAQKINITMPGIYNFPNANASIQFNDPIPNGEIVISQVFDTPFAPPSGTLSNSYWCINNYGTVKTGLNADVTFTPQSGFITNTIPANYQFYKRETIDYGNWLTPITASSVTSNSIIFSSVPTFSQFVLAANTLLPLQLLNFNAHKIAQQVNLAWNTANEKDFSHFEVQRSADGKEFNPLGKVNNNPSNSYFLTDFEPFKGINYYRLKMIDADGTSEFSRIISFNFDDEVEYVSVQNPATNGELNVTTNYKNPQFTLVNALGAVVSINTIKGADTIFKINTRSLSSGIYFLNIYSDGKSITKKIVVP